MAFTAFFMLTLYPSLLLWCSKPEFEVKSHDFNESEPTPLDQYRAQRAALKAGRDETRPFSPTGSDS